MTLTNHELFLALIAAVSGLLVFIGVLLRIVFWLVMKAITRVVGGIQDNIHTCNEKIQLQISAHERRLDKHENHINRFERRFTDHITECHVAK